ncbi:MAG TPA: LuxR C-terminal-related transcriptional regulator [Candidatus Dormibacteraeota bacterium]|nr:LuxR C-terminal-related transcriptional regulator [Candidatus Dormibacteraeota bacterium]
MQGPATHNGHDVDRSLDWLFQPFGLVGHPLAAPVAGLFACSLVLLFCLELTTPDDVLMFFALPPLLAAMWLLPHRLAWLVGLVGAASIVGATITAEQDRAAEVSICMVALGMAVAARWYAGRVSELIYEQSSPGLPVEPHNGELSAGLRLLTRRELEIARLASTGYSAREIATILHISERTVENHIANVYAKLGINSRRSLIKMAAVFANR